MPMKYIMLAIDGLPTPVLFASTLSHKVVAACFKEEVVSAGFVTIEGEKDKVHVFGKSDSLKKKIKRSDSGLIHMFLHQDDMMPRDSPEES